MKSPLILPVIHYCDDSTAMVNAAIARQCGADGVFLISHDQQDSLLGPVGMKIRRAWPSACIGLNFLHDSVDAAMDAIMDYRLDMLWVDNCGVTSTGISDRGRALESLGRKRPSVTILGSVAFKYQAPEKDPVSAARKALSCGFLPTTSGPATGKAPALDKIRSMSEAVNGRLAIASGMTPENIALFAPHLAAVLVSTGVSIDEHRFSEDLMDQFIQEAKAPQRDTVLAP